MKKITIISLHLGYGGIEKAISSLANMFCSDYEIEIISTYKLYEKPAFFIDKRVKIKYLIDDVPNREQFWASIKKFNVASFIKESIKSIKILKMKKEKMIEAIRKIDSDIIISTRPFHNNLLGKYGKKDSVRIAWEHSHHNNSKKYINNLIKSCKNLDYLVCVSKELNDFYKEKILNTKCKYISLALDDVPIQKATLKSKNIIAVGRLSKEKGFIDLVKVFNFVNKVYPDWHLSIVGDGPENKNINKFILDNGLSDAVTMHGFQSPKERDKLLLNSSIYAMTSLTESFGLVLIEAMSYGLPCIAFDSARGAHEIIDDGANGYLVENRDMQVMAQTIIKLIADDKLRQKLGLAAYKKALTFSTNNVKKEWLKLFDQEK